MTPASPSRRLVVAALGLLPVLGGCTSSPPAKLYTLAPRPATTVNRSPATVSVKQVGVAKYLDRPEIVRYSDPYQLSASEFNRWSEGFSDMVTRVLVENMSQRLPGSQVYAASGPLTLSSAQVTVEVNIDKFDANPDGAVILAAQWVVHSDKKRDQFRRQEIRVATTSDDAISQVAAMSDGLGELATQIATGLAT